MKFAVITATYQRGDGTTPEILKRAIDSLKEQTYQDFKLFLIGDGYENQEEFNSFKSMLPEGKYHIENLPYSVERTKYPTPSWERWWVSGTTPINKGIELALKEGITHIVMLDHDDIFFPNHLKLLNEAINVTNSPFIFTQGNYNGKPFPVLNQHFIDRLKINLESFYVSKEGVKFYPCIPCEISFIKQSVCIDFSRIYFRFRDRLEETGVGGPGDADMWMRIRELILKEKLPPSIYIDSLTCSNLNEGHTRTQA